MQAALAKGIDVAGLERELTALWAEASGSETGAAAGLMRSCVLNLIVYTTCQEERAEVDELLDEVIARHPCRALVLVVDRESADANLDARVFSRCQPAPRSGAQQVCGEQVTIEARGAALQTVSTAIAPLLVTDIPVFLWWKDIPHEEDRLFNRLAELADRVVIDSAAFDHPHADLRKLAQLVASGDGAHVFSDLNWGRLTLWRSLVASFWDVLDYRPALERISRVSLEFERPGHAPAEISPKALLALGWMAARLGWVAEADGARLDAQGAALRCRASERTVEVLLHPKDDTERHCGLLTSLTIETEDGCVFYVGLRPERNKLETAAKVDGGARAVGRVLNYEARTEGERLAGELDILARDLIYEEAVAAAARLLALLEDSVGTPTDAKR